MYTYLLLCFFLKKLLEKICFSKLIKGGIAEKIFNTLGVTSVL